MGAPASVDLLGTNCAPPNIESIVLFYPKLHACGAALSRSVVKLRTPAASAPAPSISRQWSHCMGSTPWVHHAADHRTYLRPSVPSKVVKLQTIMQLMNLPTFAEASDASPPSQPQPRPPFTSSARGPCVAQQCNARACCKTGLRQYLSTYSCKNCTAEESLGGVGPMSDQTGHQ